MRLIKDITSSKLTKGIPVKIYGKRGQAITVISDRGNVLIVESTPGNRFAVHKDDVF